MVKAVCYFGNRYNIKGDNTDLCKERVSKAKGSITELCALCKGLVSERRKFSERRNSESMLTLYKAVLLPRLIYNCESWSVLTPKDYKTLEDSQLIFLRNILEVSKAALFLDLSARPLMYDMEMRQLLFSISALLTRNMMIHASKFIKKCFDF